MALSGARGRRARTLEEAAPRLADSRFAPDLDRVLASTSAADDVGMALARGRRALVHERVDEALTWLTRAQSLATPRDALAIGRVAFLLAAIHLGRDEEVATDAAIAWAEGALGEKAEASADLIHARALLAERRGDRDSATALYRRVLQRANAALTPMTRVLAMRNLAAMLAHSHPRESTGLYAMALATLDADELDATTRAALENGMGYALLCSGEIDGASVKLEQSRTDAERVGHDRVRVFASFNLAIADELRGALDTSARRLTSVERDAQTLRLDELAGWTRIRTAWLALRSGARAEAARLARTLPPTPRSEHREAIATLDALVRMPQQPGAARSTLTRLANAYERRGDALTAFTLMLWIAVADAQAGRVTAARRGVARACALGRERGFRVGTSWWSPELAIIAREHASTEDAEFVEHLIVAGGPAAAEPRPDVLITRDAIVIAGHELTDRDWREGRSGSGVLRRYFRALLSAYPARLDRDELADVLWPESEGDRAIRNLYDATKDLRRVMARVPGARLDVTDGRYGLAFEPNVKLG